MRERTVRRTWRMRECMMYLANELPEYEADNICGLPVGGVEQVGQTVRGEVRQTWQGGMCSIKDREQKMYRGESNEQGENKQKETVKREDKKRKRRQWWARRNKRKRTVDSDERGGQKERRIKGKKVQEKLEKINVKGWGQVGGNLKEKINYRLDYISLLVQSISLKWKENF